MELLTIVMELLIIIMELLTIVRKLYHLCGCFANYLAQYHFEKFERDHVFSNFNYIFVWFFFCKSSKEEMIVVYNSLFCIY
jgi:hypothetical protein